MKSYTLLLLLGIILFSTNSQAQESSKLVFFQSEDPNLTEKTEQSLTTILETAPHGFKYRFELMGLVPTNQNAEEISQLMLTRANNLSAFFTERGLPQENIVFESAPLNAFLLANTAKRDSVESWVVLIEIERIIQIVEEPIALPIEKVFPKKEEAFAYNPRKKMKISGHEGTKLTVPEHAFVFADGSLVEEPVEITVREYYKTSDILMANLTTMCNDEMIETGGMLHISATCNNHEVFVKEGKSIGIKLPANNAHKPGMELFAGVETADGVNWKLASELFSKKGRGQKANRNYYAPLATGNLNIQNVINDSSTYINNGVSLNESLIQNNSWNANRNVNYDNVSAGLTLGSSIGDTYLMETSQLGWINCDRFIDAGPKTPMMVKVDTTNQPSVRLVFKDINSVMRGYYNTKDHNYQFSGLPVGQRATLIAYSVTEDGAWLDKKDIVIAADGSMKLDLSSVSESQLKSAFRKLNQG